MIAMLDKGELSSTLVLFVALSPFHVLHTIHSTVLCIHEEFIYCVVGIMSRISDALLHRNAY